MDRGKTGGALGLKRKLFENNILRFVMIKITHAACRILGGNRNMERQKTQITVIPSPTMIIKMVLSVLLIFILHTAFYIIETVLILFI